MCSPALSLLLLPTSAHTLSLTLSLNSLSLAFPISPSRRLLRSFYYSLLNYVTTKGWVVPGHGDLTVRLEEYRMAKDGRWGAAAQRGGVVKPLQALLVCLGRDGDRRERK